MMAICYAAIKNLIHPPGTRLGSWCWECNMASTVIAYILEGGWGWRKCNEEHAIWKHVAKDLTRVSSVERIKVMGDDRGWLGWGVPSDHWVRGDLFETAVFENVGMTRSFQPSAVWGKSYPGKGGTKAKGFFMWERTCVWQMDGGQQDWNLDD